MKILHLIDPTFNYSLKNKKSQLLNSVDCDFSYDEYHTSLGDLSYEQILSVVPKFDSVNFCKETFVDNETYKNSILLIKYIQSIRPVTNFVQDQLNTFTDNIEYLRARPDTPVLWVFGCSHSHGVGLLPGELRYADIVSQHLGLPLKLVSKPGSSLHWSARHLFNADIRPNDIVIWQLTTPNRVSVYNGVHTKEVVLSCTDNRYLVEVNTDEQIYFNHLTLLMFGVQYLRAKNIKFCLTSIEPYPPVDVGLEYIKYPEYCYALEFQVDQGTDGMHHGPLSHKNLALCLINHIQCNND